eukprot:XP_011679192.1 PREDICTED: uncharacterized protein LOC100889019 isoform X2 [Strongylocentrotus purpuratus]
MEEESSGVVKKMDKEVLVTAVSEGSSDFVRIKQEVDLPEDDTYYPMDFGISVEDEEEMNPVYVKMRSKEPGSSEQPEVNSKPTAARGKGKAKAKSVLRRGRSQARAKSSNPNPPGLDPDQALGWESEEEYLDGCMTYDDVTSRDASANGGSQQQRRHKIFSDLTNEEEEIMVRWIRETDCLYNKKRIDYRDFPMKDKLWADKAKEMGKKAKVLQVWYKSIRTRYVKIARKKSQFGVSDLTERDHWIMMKFGFLAKHIGKVRLKTNFRNSRLHDQVPRKLKVASSVCPGRVSPADLSILKVYSVNEDDDGPGGHKEPPPEDHMELLPPPPPPPDSCFSPGPGPSWRALESISKDGPGPEGGPAAQTSAEVQTASVNRKYEQFIQMQETVLMSMLQPKAVNERSAYGDWLKAVIEGFDRSVWRDFQIECSQLIHKYQCRNDQIFSGLPSKPSTSWSADNNEQPEGES